MTPVAREGIGLNLGKVVQLVKIGGTLREPKLVADASGVVSTGLSAGAAVATGGLSLIAEGLLERALKGGDICAAPAVPDTPPPAEENSKTASGESGA